MKKDIHPASQLVAFGDSNNDFKFIARSTVSTKETITWEDGHTYPFIKVEVSSASHPFYTGKRVVSAKTGQVGKFMKRYQKQNAA